MKVWVMVQNPIGVVMHMECDRGKPDEVFTEIEEAESQVVPSGKEEEWRARQLRS